MNLLDVAWIPVRLRGGHVIDVGLLEFFSRAHDIEGLAETSPPNLIALHRLLLAIVHRALCLNPGHWTDADRARWWREGLPVALIHAYLETWRDRFWLFHPTHPFMQVAALAQAEETRDKLKPWTQVALASANGNAPVVFDHALDGQPAHIDPLVLLRQLLGFLQFTPGGLVKVFRSADKAGPLVNTAAVLPQGRTLHETLLMGLHPHSASSVRDLPSWERTPPDIAALTVDPLPATGPCDRYSRLSRAVLLVAADEAGVQPLRWVRFGAGVALMEDDAAPDPMSSYRAGSTHLVRLNFAEGKAAWRDLGALLPDATGTAAQPAAVLSWAVNLLMALDVDDCDVPVLLAGLTSDQAKLVRWRCEHFRLPVAALSRADMAQLVREALTLAESTYKELRQVVAQMLARTLPDPASKETYERARDMVSRGPVTNAYFTVAERALPQWLVRVGRSEIDEASAEWNRVLLRACQNAWQTSLAQLGTSTAALRAQAQLHHRYQQLLKPLRDLAAEPATPSIEESTP
ncbi:type I-E CRISPR-associated protein Cse1/CasA [Sphaerotilus mobilis]|uniref:type I-E CRISPR-associated protein Cse1/CasA n=1 Tax=Sphaerotilus mobilis TaxID=47994 RepID=UPI001A929334|nr:type I-E CRISPR-associated protein Cse1/CasA [Sphaerotilus mobilis]